MNIYGCKPSDCEQDQKAKILSESFGNLSDCSLSDIESGHHCLSEYSFCEDNINKTIEIIVEQLEQ